MRRPAPETIEDIRHPGPRAEERRAHALCHATHVEFEVAGDRLLLKALGEWAETKGYCSAVLDLGSLSLSAFEYVMPDRAVDDRHVAWYSDTHFSAGATLDDAVAILGWRDGEWFAHIHAYWQEQGSRHLGHLLPHTLNTEKASSLTGYGLKDAKFEADLDPETEFTLFRVKANTNGQTKQPPNALITTLAPFEDLHESILELGQAAGFDNYTVHGLGSLAGAAFECSEPMTGLISEVLVMPGAGCTAGKLELPMRCIDLEEQYREGVLLPGKAPTLVTCELLITSLDPSQIPR